jgi:hypothetical protein
VKARLMQFNFHCLTGLRPCAGGSEMLPAAYKEYLSEGKVSEAEHKTCAVPFWVWARDEPAVFQGEVLNAKRPHNSPEESATWLVTLHITSMLKGRLRLPLDQPQVIQVYDLQPDKTGNFPYRNVIAAGDPAFGEAFGWPFQTESCEVLDATPKNIAEAKKGVLADFDPQIQTENAITK